MSMAKLFLGLLGIFISILRASSGSVDEFDGYGRVQHADLLGEYVYWISCEEYDEENSTMSCRTWRESVSNEHEVYCNIELDSKYTKNFKVLSKDLVALNWYAKYKENFQLATTVINISNCNKSEARVNGTVTISDIAYGDHFRLATTFISSNGKYQTIFFSPDACNATLCALTFDAEGEDVRISSFYETAFEQSASVFDIQYLDSGKESYLVDQLIEISLLRPTGLKFLISGGWDTIGDESITHGAIRFCRIFIITRDATNCTTFDVNGDIVSNITVNLTHVFDDIEVENLPNGEFLLFTHTKKWEHTYVTKVGADGKRIGTFELTEQPQCETLCDNKSDLEIIDNEYCRYILRQSLLGGFDYKRMCFSDDDFTNST